MIKNIIGFISIAGILTACNLPKESNQSKKSNQYTIGFYNVENLFDTEDDPKTNDNEFTPKSEKKWDNERYQSKIDKIAQVVKATDKTDYPAFFGFCEVENNKVLDDLISNEQIKDGKYAYVHYDSPDSRGIDNALIYRKNILEVISSDAIKVTLNNPNDRTRDILYVKAKFKQSDKNVHIFVNHWPSRRSGQLESEEKRIVAATVLREQVDAIQKDEQNPAIIIMGDFNDTPKDRSIAEVLNACPVVSDCFLKNLNYTYAENRQGSYNFRGDWQALDQLIVSKSLLMNTESIYTPSDKASIFSETYVMFTKDNGETIPSRTYGGNNYYGGYSDHLAIYMPLIVR